RLKTRLPTYGAKEPCPLFSDIPNNRIMRLLWDDNHLSVFREPSNNSNGNTVNPQGRLVTCERRTVRVARTELDGSITVIADKYNGKRLNSPNDVVVASNGSIWFTDPTYGIGGNYEGLKQGPRILPIARARVRGGVLGFGSPCVAPAVAESFANV